MATTLRPGTSSLWLGGAGGLLTFFFLGATQRYDRSSSAQSGTWFWYYALYYVLLPIISLSMRYTWEFTYLQFIRYGHSFSSTCTRVWYISQAKLSKQGQRQILVTPAYHVHSIKSTRIKQLHAVYSIINYNRYHGNVQTRRITYKIRGIAL